MRKPRQSSAQLINHIRTGQLQFLSFPNFYISKIFLITFKKNKWLRLLLTWLSSFSSLEFQIPKSAEKFLYRHLFHLSFSPQQRLASPSLSFSTLRFPLPCSRLLPPASLQPSRLGHLQSNPFPNRYRLSLSPPPRLI